jgi:putative phage-type endonuclease
VTVAVETVPAATVIQDNGPHTPEWRAVRRGGITATDLPKILGLSQYGNALSVWAHKRGELDDDEAGEAAQWGLILEDPVAVEWARRRNSGVRPVGVMANVEHPWRRASLDRLVVPCPDGDGPCALQVKTTSWAVADRWRDDIPDTVLAQVMWEMVVSGFKHEHVAALVGGQKLVDHRVDYDPTLAEFLIAEATRVWECVQSGQAPEAPPSALQRRILDALHPERRGMAVAPRATVEALLWKRADLSEELSGHNAAVKRTKTAMEAVDSQLVELLGDAEALGIEGEVDPVVTYRLINRAAYAVSARSYRQIHVDKNRSTA